MSAFGRSKHASPKPTHALTGRLHIGSQGEAYTPDGYCPKLTDVFETILTARFNTHDRTKTLRTLRDYVRFELTPGEPWDAFLHERDNDGERRAVAYLPPRQQRRRHRFMEIFGIGPRWQMPSGLLTFRAADVGLQRWMLQRNRTLVPIKELAAAYRIGDAASCLIIEPLCRLGEAAQVVQSPDGWTMNDQNDPPTMSFSNIPKDGMRRSNGEARNCDVSDRLFADLMALAEDIARSDGHADGWLPEVSANRDLISRQPRPRAFIMQWAGRMLTYAQIEYVPRRKNGNSRQRSPRQTVAIA